MELENNNNDVVTGEAVTDIAVGEETADSGGISNDRLQEIFAEHGIEEAASPFQMTEEADEEAAAEKTADDAEGAENLEADADKAGYPQNLPQELRAEFDRLDPKIRDYMADREKEFTRRLTAYDPERTFGRKMQETIKPYEAMIHAGGGTPEAVVGALLQAGQVLQYGTPDQKAELLISEARKQGVDLSRYLNGQERRDTQSDYGLPQDHPIMRELSVLKETVEAQQNYLRTQKNQTELQAGAVEAAVNKQIDNEVGDFYKRALPYTDNDNVRNMMATLLESGQADTIDAAYETAIWTVPEVREAEMRKQAVERAKAENERAREAKRQVMSVGNSGGGNPSRLPDPNAALFSQAQDIFRKYGVSA